MPSAAHAKECALAQLRNSSSAPRAKVSRNGSNSGPLTSTRPGGTSKGCGLSMGRAAVFVIASSPFRRVAGRIEGARNAVAGPRRINRGP